MTRYIIRRLLLLFFVLLGISIVTFTMMHLVPGGPADAMLGEHATDASVARFRKAYGLDDPIPIQYLRYISKIARGDLGRSVRTNFLVTEELAQRFPATLELTLGAMLVACLIGIPAGIIAAYYHNSFFDLTTMVGALIGVSMPVFWLGLILMYVFGFKLQWLPPSTRLTVGVELNTIAETYNLKEALAGPTGDKIIVFTDFLSNFYVFDALITRNPAALKDVLKHLVLPSLALGSIPMAYIARMTRSSLLEVLGQDYIRTARAKGLRERAVIAVHALKNAFLPIITVIGLMLGGLLGGAILTETIFSWPGMGRLVVDRVLARDYPAVQGGVLLIAFVFVVVNLLVDISYAYLDPRIRYD
jgi:peptide/nickel transport system permease protein